MPVTPPAGSEPVVATPGLVQSAPRPATAEDVPRLAGALADAFMSDPVYTWMLPGRLRMRPRLRTMFVAEMEQYVLRNGGTVWTTSAYDGAVCELPPGAWELPKSMTGKEALRWLRAFGRRLPLAIRVQRAMEARHLHEPHFYVRIVGVRSSRQGRGIGSALMRPTLRESRLGRGAGLHRSQHPAQCSTVRAARLPAYRCARASGRRTTGLADAEAPEGAMSSAACESLMSHVERVRRPT